MADKAAKTEALWREAWVGSPHIGELELARDAETGRETLVIRCKEIQQKYRCDAEVIDDGRTAGVGIGDVLAFGVVERRGKKPLAINIYRTPAKKKKKREEDVLPPDLSGELTGLVRNRSTNTGDCFIECKAVFEAYKRDAKIQADSMPEGIALGDAIYFEVEAPASETAAPLAKSVRKAPRAIAEELKALGFRTRMPRFAESKGGGKGGVGRGPVVRRTGGPTIRMNGIVKRPSINTGRYFIFCQDISDVYGKDCQIPPEEVPAGGLNVGDRISFDVDEPVDGRPVDTPWAFNVRVVGGTSGQRKVLPDTGDGEEEGEVAAVEEDVKDELAFGSEEEEVAVEEDEAELELQKQAEREELSRRPQPKAKRRKVAQVEDDGAEEPTTTEGWMAAQERLFPGLPELKEGWIRIRSKTRGLVYYYNMDTGESTPHEPVK